MNEKIINICNSVGAAGVTQTTPVQCYGCHGASASFIISEVSKNTDKQFVLVAPTQKRVFEIASELHLFFQGDTSYVDIFPSYNIMPYKPISYQSNIAAERVRLLYKLLSDKPPKIIIVSAETMVQKVIPKESLIQFSDIVMENEEINRDAFVAKLIEGGYTRCPIVEEPGDFSVRGGIIDLFTPAYEEPVRIEFFDDMVESIKTFSVETQQKTNHLSEIIVLPACEAIIEKSNIDTIIQRVRKQASLNSVPVSKLRNLVEGIKGEYGANGIESMLPLIYQEPDSLFDYFNNEIVYIFNEPDEIRESIFALERQLLDHYETAKKSERLCIEPKELYMSFDTVEERTNSAYKIEFRTDFPLINQIDENKSDGRYKFTVESNHDISRIIIDRKNTDHILLPLAEWIKEQNNAGCRVAIVSKTASQSERIRELLGPYGLELQFSETFPDITMRTNGPLVCMGNITEGFLWKENFLAIITEDEIFGKKRRRARVSKKSTASQFINFDELTDGDFVVHSVHGIGKYSGLKKLTFKGVTNDFLQIEFKDNDILYLPVDVMGMIQKYVGIEGYQPVLDKMGGKSWSTIKNKARDEVEKIAGELLKLYSERKVKKGFSFSPTDSYFRDFEASFPYDETRDQLKAIDDVLLDMEDSTCMERLVCGDVGYGKTEVGLRAAFKAIADGKQVAVLVPTTVLAEQHNKTFIDRFKNYPVTVNCLNRFRTAKQQKEIVENIASGKTDIVIGTHRLLSKDISFKDLGLIIIDEEQRFGVRHKEKLKQLKTNVDVLMLSATPIPRTLHMSLTGLRDISVISTPPEERRAILTYISEYDDTVITDAFRKENDRGGQSFFIHNNVKTIEKMAIHLRALLPELRFGVAHGQMPESVLEKVMLSFLNREIDVLVCTTIVESGLDIQSANTMIINKADRFGLSQIYQLRGRIGRGGEQAYAYLFIPEEDALSKNAQKRLKVLLEHCDLGAGFQIAMNDLRIRGGGATLGASQSGHIAAVGYEMFLDLMEHAVAELKGEPVLEELEPEINVQMSSFFPENYIEEIDQRLMIYRRLAKMNNLKEISEIKDELTDRYGKLPMEAQNILLKIMLRVLCKKAGVKRLDLTENQMLLSLSEIHQKNPAGIIDLILQSNNKMRFSEDNILKINMNKTKSINGLLVQAKNILKTILGAVEN